MQEQSSRPATAAGLTDDFSLSFARDQGGVVVGISGELDCATAAILEERLDDLLSAQGNLSVVLDLTNMTFVDTSGLSVIVTAHRHLEERGGLFSLRNPSSATRKLFDVTGLNRILTIDAL